MIDGTDHASTLDGLLGVQGGAIPDHDVAVFASSEEHVVNATDG